MFKELYEYRQLLKSNISKEVRGKYKGSFLGILWSFVNPLLMTLVYAIVFPFLLKSSQPHYTTFIVIAIIPWTWFTYTIMSGTNTFLVNAGIIKKVYFPREILPLAVVISNTIQYFFSAVIIFIALLVSGVGISWTALFLPVIVLAQAIFSLGLIMVLSAGNVYIRDVQYIMNPVMMIWMYACPILYSISMVPERFLKIYRLNPMTLIMEQYQNILYNKQMPDLSSLGVVYLVSIVMLIIGYLTFSKLQRRFAEEV